MACGITADHDRRADRAECDRAVRERFSHLRSRFMRRVVLGVVLAVSLAACGDDGADAADDPGCEIWRSYVADMQANAGGYMITGVAVVKARGVVLNTKDAEVEKRATALVERLESGDDLGDATRQLNNVCGVGAP